MTNRILIAINTLALVVFGYWLYKMREPEPLAAFIIGVGTLIALIWREQMINTDDERRNINVTSYNQSGGITANQVNIGSHPRTLNNIAENQLQQLLNGKKGQLITIESVMGDGEAFSFANQIKNYLAQIGHTVKGVDQVVYSHPVIGQEFDAEELKIIIGTKQ